MPLKEYLLSIEGNNLENNVYTKESHHKAKAFLEKYPFLSRDKDYSDFIEKINGIEIYGTNLILIFYGFALSEPELVYPVEKYLDEMGFLLVGEYTDKRKGSNWRTIGYYFHQVDKSPVIYAKFFSDIPEAQGRYYPLCIGFQELIKIALNKSFDEQFKMAYSPEYPKEEV